MIKKLSANLLIFVLGVLGIVPALAAPALASAAAPAMHYHARAASATAPGTDSRRTCDERYKYSDGLEGILQHPFVKAAWTHNTCTWYLQTKVKYTTSCVNSTPSGAVKAINLWAEADGTGHVYCSAWIRFHAGGEPWGSWHKLANTG